jgi:hypothetical protein
LLDPTGRAIDVVPVARLPRGSADCLRAATELMVAARLLSPLDVSDTHPLALEAQIEILRRLEPTERLQQVAELTRATIHLSRQAIRNAMPHASPGERTLRWIELTYGLELANRARPFAAELGEALPT